MANISANRKAQNFLKGDTKTPGCAVQQTGAFFGPRFGQIAPYTGRNFGATFAQTQDDVGVLNAGFGCYHFDAVDVWAATYGPIIGPIHAGIQLFG